MPTRSFIGVIMARTATPAVLTIGSDDDGGTPSGFLRVAGLQIPTTGVLGVSNVDGEPTARAFPSWATVPSFQDLAAGRRWHFFFAWLFVINGILYLGFSLLSGHFKRDLAPKVNELSPSPPRPRGSRPCSSPLPRRGGGQTLQCTSETDLSGGHCYSAASHGPDGSDHVTWGGCRSSRIDRCIWRTPVRAHHPFRHSGQRLSSSSIVHVAMVVLSGTWNNIRSMITGRYAIQEKGPQS